MNRLATYCYLKMLSLVANDTIAQNATISVITDKTPGIAAETKDVYQLMVQAADVNARLDFMYRVEVMDAKGRGKIFPGVNVGQLTW